MGDIVQKVTTDLTFAQNGVLVPPGSIIQVDVSKGDFTDENTPNLADVGGAIVNVAVPVAPIAPAGPNPTMPQQVPPGAFQTATGYVVPGGALLVAEGSQAAIDAAANGTMAEQQGVEEDAPVRRQAAEGTGDATTAALTPQPKDSLGDADRAELEEFRRQRASSDAGVPNTPAPFDAEGVIGGTIPEVKAKLIGLNREQLLAVQSAEADREVPRAGVHNAVDAALADLDGGSNDL